MFKSDNSKEIFENVSEGNIAQITISIAPGIFITYVGKFTSDILRELETSLENTLNMAMKGGALDYLNNNNPASSSYLEETASADDDVMVG